MHVEVELKLELSAAALHRLRRHPFVQQHKQGRAQTFRLFNTYYDTPDCLLARQKAALRLRQQGKRYLQTVKSKGQAEGAHFARPEWEWPLPSKELDFSLLEETPLGELQPEQLSALTPFFTTDFQRTVWTLASPEGCDPWVVELTIDSGEVRAHGNGDDTILPIHEVELELKHGTAKDLYDVALTLTEGLACRVSLISKAERGYSLKAPGLQVPKKSPLPDLRKDQTASEAFQAIGRACLVHALHNDLPLRNDKHPDAVHQMRVALRRLRSAFGLFKELLESPEASPQAQKIKESLRWLASELGDARDLDVFESDILSPALQALGQTIDLSPLTLLIEQRKQAAYQNALDVLASPDYGRVLMEAAAWFEGGEWLAGSNQKTPIKAFAQPVLERRFKSVLHAGKNLASLDASARHSLRIEVKKLRYACEFFACLFSKKKSTAFAKILGELQESLGHLNDNAVAQQRLLTLARSGNPGDDGLPLHIACGAVLGWHHAFLPASLASCQQTWKVFEKQQPFWR